MQPPKLKDLLSEPRLKIKWAKREIQKINSAVAAYIAGKPYGQRIEIDFNSFEKIFKFGLTKQIPELLVVDIGQTINAIRSSLDLLVACLVAVHIGKDSSTTNKFPFGKTVDAFEEGIKRIKNRLPNDAVTLIEDLKPYKGGNDFLFALHDADVVGKHRKIVDVRMFATSVTIGGPNGAHGTLITKSAGFVVVKKDAFKRWVSLDEGIEFMRIPLDAETDFQYNPTLDVMFNNIEVIEGQSVVATLHQFIDLAQSIILAFESRFFP